MTVDSLKTSLVKTCQLELFIADKFSSYLGRPSRAFSSRTKEHKRVVKELAYGGAALLYGLYAK